MNQPNINIQLDRKDDQFAPGDVLVCEYRVQMPEEVLATAVEASILWSTSGKGEEDFGVHFFERRARSTVDTHNLSRPHRISTVLPKSPLSYEGSIVQVRWSVRVRVFVGNKQFSDDHFFQLGNTTAVVIEEANQEAE